MYVVLAVILGLLVGGGIVYFLATGRPILLWDRGFRIFAVESEEARDWLVSEFLPVFGLKPDRRIDSPLVKRTLMNDGMTVISHTHPEVWEAMGSPAAGLALKAKDPVADAIIAVDMLKENGYEAELLDVRDPSVPEGAMVFIKTGPFKSTLLVFRKHVRHFGKIPPKWKKR